MGGGRFDHTDWQTHATRTAAKRQAQIFRQSNIHKDLDPMNIKVRESCDSKQNPNSTPIILAADETGSMGVLAETIIKKDLGVIMNEIYDRKPVSDPHLMIMGIGDAYTDNAPLQVSQFEAEVDKITDQCANVYIEASGGGNHGESYLLAWYFAAFKTKIDSMLKRKKKGYLFTIGDEPPHSVLTRDQIKRILGDKVEADMTVTDLRDAASQNWELFHLIVKPEYGKDTVTEWRGLLGERAILVDDHTHLGEIIVSTIQVLEGHDPDKVVKSWSGATSLVVAKAVGQLTAKGKAGVVRY